MRDLNLLYVFEALWRERSVTTAAESLGLTQAAVSSALKRLRDHYGDKLFTLAGRRMEPTPYASEIAHQLLDALSMVRKTGNLQSQFDAAISNRLFTIRTRDIGEVVCFPSLLQPLLRVAPGLKVRTIFKPIEETLSGLGSGKIDFALGFLPSLETSIHRKILFSQHYVCAMRSGHPLEPKELTLDLFRQQDHLLVEYAGSGHQVVEQALNDAGVKQRIKVRLPQYLAAPHFIIASDLLWCLPAILAERLAVHYPLIIKPVPLQLPSFEIALYWHERFHRDPGNKWFRDFVTSQLQTDQINSVEVGLLSGATNIPTAVRGSRRAS